MKAATRGLDPRAGDVRAEPLLSMSTRSGVPTMSRSAPTRITRRWLAILATAATATAGLVVAGPAVAAPTPAQPAAVDWSGLSSTLAGITGDWTTEDYAGAIGTTMPDTAILGNGDLGVTSAGKPGEKT